MVEKKLVYTVAECAEILSISKYLVYEDIRIGRLQVVRFGRRILVPHRSLYQRLGIPEEGELMKIDSPTG